MKKLAVLVALLFSLSTVSLYAAPPAPPVIGAEGNVWSGVSFPHLDSGVNPDHTICEVSTPIDIDYREQVSVYVRMDAIETGGRIVSEVSSDGSQWYADGPGATGAPLVKSMRFKICYNVVNLTVSVFSR